MLILVDYDNISPIERRKGLKYLIDKIIRTIDYDVLETKKRISVRLYGGWYELDKLTITAQELTVLIQNTYPTPFTIGNVAKTHNLTLNVELAYSLLIDKQKHLWHTCRTRSYTGKIQCKDPVSVGCHKKDCIIKDIQVFLNTGKCPKRKCTITTRDVLYKKEQKLVDTMLTADLIYYSNSEKKDVCVVTSDDDLWPGIISAIKVGSRITHIHTKPRKIPEYYCSGLASEYIQVLL